MWLSDDSEAPVAIFSLPELTRVMRGANIDLIPGEDKFLDYNNDRINILG